MYKTITDNLQWEMKKSDFLQKYIKVISLFLENYYSTIEDNSNYTILNNLKDQKLIKYGNRYGVIKKSRWRDPTFRRAIAIARKTYESDLSIIDNFYNLITKTTNYKANIEYMKYKGENGAINVDVKIPPGEPIDLLTDLEKVFVYGCRVDYDVSMDIDIFNEINFFTTRYVHNKLISNNDWR